MVLFHQCELVVGRLIVSVYFWLKYFLFRFDMTQLMAKARIALNANYILSSWVYLDDLDTSKNVLYVSPQILSKSSEKYRNIYGKRLTSPS